MSNRRTVIVEEVSYQGTDGEDHVAHRGDEIEVSDAGIDHVDTFQASSHEGRWAAFVEQNTEKPVEEKSSGRKKS